MKAKIIFQNGTFVIVDKKVEEVTADLAAGGMVNFPVSTKKYNYALNTINIGEETVPAYDVVTTETVVNAALVARVEEAEEALALVYTGTADIEEEVGAEEDQPTIEPEEPTGM